MSRRSGGVALDIEQFGLSAASDHQLELTREGGQLVGALAPPFPEQGTVRHTGLAGPGRQQVRAVDMPGGVHLAAGGRHEGRQQVGQVHHLLRARRPAQSGPAKTRKPAREFLLPRASVSGPETAGCCPGPRLFPGCRSRMWLRDRL